MRYVNRVRRRYEEMSRRRTKAQDRALVSLIVLGLLIGLPIYAVVKTGEMLGWPLFIGGTIALIVAVVWFRIARARSLEAERVKRIQTRREALLQKYGDPQVVEKILTGSIWQGQSAEQLQDSRGQPLDMGERVFKKSTRQTWKYVRTGVNRFALRIMLEDGIVVGWDDKT
jgi:hypothetical protein